MRSRAQAKSGASSCVLVVKVLLAQLGLSVGCAAIFLGLAGFAAGYSALLGGLTCVIPNAFLALRLVAPRRESGPAALVRAAYIGELGKLALTVLMFGIVFTQVKPLAAGPLFTGFIVAQLATLGGLLMRDQHRPHNKVVRTSNRNGD